MSSNYDSPRMTEFRLNTSISSLDEAGLRSSSLPGPAVGGVGRRAQGGDAAAAATVGSPGAGVGGASSSSSSGGTAAGQAQLAFAPHLEGRFAQGASDASDVASSAPESEAAVLDDGREVVSRGTGGGG